MPIYPKITKLDGGKLPLEIRHYSMKSNSYKLYDDDGTMFDYEQGGLYVS